MTKIKVKQLSWKKFGDVEDYYANEFDIRITENGAGGWGLSPQDYPHFGDFPLKSLEEAKEVAQKDFENYILSMIDIDDK